MYLAMKVLELSQINEMSEAIRTTDLGLIQDVANPFAQQARQAVNFMEDIF